MIDISCCSTIYILFMQNLSRKRALTKSPLETNTLQKKMKYGERFGVSGQCVFRTDTNQLLTISELEAAKKAISGCDPDVIDLTTDLTTDPCAQLSTDAVSPATPACSGIAVTSPLSPTLDCNRVQSSSNIVLKANRSANGTFHLFFFLCFCFLFLFCFNMTTTCT